MRQIRFFSAVFAAYLSLFTFLTPANAAGPSHSTETAIRAENARWAAAFGRGAYEAIGHLYTEDGALLPPGGNRVIGAHAITEYFVKGYSGGKPGNVSFSNFEFYGDDQAVAEVSETELRDSSGKLTYRGRQILVFVKQAGTWKLKRDMWNDLPAAGSDGR